MLFWRIKWQQGPSKYLVEQPLSPGIHACFGLRMGASKIRSIRGSGHLLYMNCGSLSLYVVACLVLIPVYFEPFSTLNKRAWADRIWQSGRSWMAFWLSKPTQISHPPPSNHQLGIPSSSIKCCSKCFWYDGYVLSVLKPFLKRVLHVLRRTILGQYLRVNVLRSFVVYLGQGCLSGSRLSVSRTPCTAS